MASPHFHTFHCHARILPPLTACPQQSHRPGNAQHDRFCLSFSSLFSCPPTVPVSLSAHQVHPSIHIHLSPPPLPSPLPIPDSPSFCRIYPRPYSHHHHHHRNSNSQEARFPPPPHTLNLPRCASTRLHLISSCSFPWIFLTLNCDRLRLLLSLPFPFTLFALFPSPIVPAHRLRGPIWPPFHALTLSFCLPFILPRLWPRNSVSFFDLFFPTFYFLISLAVTFPISRSLTTDLIAQSDLPLCGSQSTRQPIGFRTPPTIVAFSEASAFESYLSTTTSPTATSQIRSRTTPRIRLELIPGSAPIVSLPHPGSVYRAVSCSSSTHSHSSGW